MKVGKCHKIISSVINWNFARKTTKSRITFLWFKVMEVVLEIVCFLFFVDTIIVQFL